MIHGVLLIDKPIGSSSADCVYFLRKVLKTKKIGHCGTLDPLATGVLPVCIGEATKFSSYISNQNKEYEVEISFGVQTTTGDIQGEEIYNKHFVVDEKKLHQEALSFLGEQEQIPPMFSAIKKNGKPLYYWARKGVYLKRAPRIISISSIDLLASYQHQASLRVSCSKGTYIRSLAESIGERLGTKACVSALRRTKVGEIENKNLTMLDGDSRDAYKDKLLPVDHLIKHIQAIHLNQIDAKKIINGQFVDYNGAQQEEGLIRIYTNEGVFVGIGSIDSSKKISAKRLLSNPLN